MDNDIVRGIKIGFGLFFTTLVLFGIVFAAGFHSANEILSGTFLGNYSFNGNINMTSGTLYFPDGSNQSAAASPNWVLIGTAEASNSGDITVTGLSSEYDTYMISISSIRPNTQGVDLWMRVGDSSGIDIGASDYGWMNEITYYDYTSPGSSYRYDSSDSKMVLNGEGGGAFNGLGNSANDDFNMVIWLTQPANSSGYSQFFGQGSDYQVSKSRQLRTEFTGKRLANIDLDRVQLLMSGGLIAKGRLTVWGLKHE